MIFTLRNQAFTLMPGVPAGYENHRLHGTNARCLVSSLATLFLQEIRLGEVFLQYLLIDLAADTPCRFRLPAAGNIVVCCLHGYCMVNTNGNLSEHRYHFSPPQDNRLISLPGTRKSHTALLILHYDTDTTLQPSSAPSSGGYSITPPYLSPPMLDAALQLIRASYFPEPLPYHIGLVRKIRQMVLSQTDAGPLSFTPADIAAIHTARNLAGKQLHRQVSLSEISRQCGLNREKLRTGFKALFGTTVAAYARQCRLNLAREQLVYTQKPIKQIARVAGYRNLSNFCTACKQCFGMTPGEMRRKGGD